MFRCEIQNPPFAVKVSSALSICRAACKPESQPGRQVGMSCTYTANPVFVMLQLIGCAWWARRLTVRIRSGWLIFLTNLLDIAPSSSLSLSHPPFPASMSDRLYIFLSPSTRMSAHHSLYSVPDKPTATWKQRKISSRRGNRRAEENNLTRGELKRNWRFRNKKNTQTARAIALVTKKSRFSSVASNRFRLIWSFKVHTPVTAEDPTKTNLDRSFIFSRRSSWETSMR